MTSKSADAMETAADWKARHDELMKDNIMLMEQLKAARDQLAREHRRSSEAAMEQIEKVITDQMQARLKAYEAIRVAAQALLLQQIGEANAGFKLLVPQGFDGHMVADLSEPGNLQGHAADLHAVLTAFGELS